MIYAFVYGDVWLITGVIVSEKFALELVRPDVPGLKRPDKV